MIQHYFLPGSLFTDADFDFVLDDDDPKLFTELDVFLSLSTDKEDIFLLVPCDFAVDLASFELSTFVFVTVTFEAVFLVDLSVVALLSSVPSTGILLELYTDFAVTFFNTSNTAWGCTSMRSRSTSILKTFGSAVNPA